MNIVNPLDADGVRKFVSLLNAALQAIWADNIAEKDEPTVTIFLKEYLVKHRQELPVSDDVQIDIGHGSSCEEDSKGALHKEIETATTFDKSVKFAYPNIIFHKEGTDDKNIVVIDLKKTSNGGRDVRVKDIETIQTLVSGKQRYRLGVTIDLGIDSALLCWYLSGREAGSIAEFKSSFTKGRSPSDFVFVKDCSQGIYSYRIYGGVHGEIERSLTYITKYDPARLVLHDFGCPGEFVRKFGSSWVVDAIGEEAIECHPKTIFERSPTPPERRRTCMLMVTHKCNLNCVYCYEKHKDDAEMSFETAKSAILAEAAYVESHRDEFDEMEIDFMGGEPLMNMTLIKQIVEWLEREHPINIPWICFATTNGTLINQHKDWLREHKESVCLGISYDGKSNQGSNRGNQAEKVPLELCHELWPYQGFKATVSKESLRTLSEDVIWFHKNHPDFQLDVSLAQGVDWTSADADIYYQELHTIGDYYLGLSTHSNVKPINLLTRNLAGLMANDDDAPQRKFCGSGTGMMTYDCDGQKYGCHMFTPIVLAENAMPLDSIGHMCRDMPLEDETCVSCLLKHYCPTCLGFNFAFRGDMRVRDKRQCGMFMAELRASCQFQMAYFVKRKVLATEDEAVRLKGVVDVYQKLEKMTDFHGYPFVVEE